MSRQANCECFFHICSLLLSSKFSLFLWIDLLDLVIPKRIKWPLLTLAVDSIAYDLVAFIRIFCQYLLIVGGLEVVVGWKRYRRRMRF